MVVVGLTGGIGSGKSTVASLLARRGALVVDADELARAALAPGSPGARAVAERFGEEVVPGGTVDRAALAEIVFADDAARADLEAIVHPLVEAEIRRRLDELAPSDAVVVLVVPLLVETGVDRYPIDGVLVVDVPPELAVERLVASRSMTPEEAWRRVRAQAPRAARLRAADFVILNVGTQAELAEMAQNAWRWIEGLRAGSAG
ncbi:MAG TPA: dephospho-CoA kinase [Acidimicrobiales bacterium]|nr:dephospho-CoA kinase [Acidimicrobiales bacterium]